MWLIVQRELRELARRPVLPGTRVLGAGLLMLVLWLAWERAEPGPGVSGRGFLYGLNRFLFLGIWLLAPLMTSDCLSREKREGTLGLLMMTPLRPKDVVLGKALSQTLFAASFVLAALPVMIVPILVGGVLWLDAVRMALYHAGALGLALASGLAASSISTSWWRAKLGAFVVATTTSAGFVLLHLTVPQLLRTTPPIPGATPTAPWQIYKSGISSLLSRFALGRRDGLDDWWRDWPGVPTTWTSVLVAGTVAAGAWLLVTLIVTFASFGIQRTWRDDPRESRWPAIPDLISRVRLQRHHRRFRTRLLGRNPIRWLQFRTWDLRVGGWLLAAGVAIGWWLGTDSEFRAAEGFVRVLRPALLGMVALVATSSFRMERESGALELWLVTPMSPATILLGRLSGILIRTSMAAILLILLPYLPSVVQWLEDVDLTPGRRQWLAYRMMGDLDFLLWIVATALFGLAVSLSRISFLPAFGLTWVLHDAPSLAIRVSGWAWEALQGRVTTAPSVWDAPTLVRCSGLLGAGAVSLWSWGFARQALARRTFVPGADTPRLPRRSIPGEVRGP
ncbi:MAG: ABC transporter permease subunit [Verrucomicrobiales bacterium]|nr:ABC transporter permease subunit [Verrucomicrobiales bacterium]